MASAHSSMASLSKISGPRKLYGGGFLLLGFGLGLSGDVRGAFGIAALRARGPEARPKHAETL